jgi:hypothetical protein
VLRVLLFAGVIRLRAGPCSPAGTSGPRFPLRGGRRPARSRAAAGGRGRAGRQALRPAHPDLHYQPFLQALFEAADKDSTLLPTKSPVYLSFPWYLVTEEQAQDLGDAAVWTLRFLVGRPGFVKVFHAVEPSERPYRIGNGGVVLLWKNRPPPSGSRSRTHRRERKLHGVSYYLYPFQTSLLVRHPRVTRLI